MKNRGVDRYPRRDQYRTRANGLRERSALIHHDTCNAKSVRSSRELFKC
jgi:hypothetical protein